MPEVTVAERASDGRVCDVCGVAREGDEPLMLYVEALWVEEPGTGVRAVGIDSCVLCAAEARIVVRCVVEAARRVANILDTALDHEGDQ